MLTRDQIGEIIVEAMSIEVHQVPFSERVAIRKRLVGRVESALRAARDEGIEAAAKVTEKQARPWVKKRGGEYWEGYREAIEDAVEDIRALKHKEPADADR